MVLNESKAKDNNESKVKAKTIGINSQLSRNFIFVALTVILFIAVMSNMGITYYFGRYIQSLRVEEDIEIVNYIDDSLLNQDLTGEFQYNIFHYAISKGTEIRIINSSDEIVLDSLSMQGRGQGWGRGMIQRKAMTYLYNTYELKNGDVIINKVQIGHPENLISSEQDKKFLIALNVIIFITLVFAVLIAVFVSRKVANRFVAPLLGIQRNIEIISRGKYHNTNPVFSVIKELNEISSLVEGLAKKLESQDSLRKQLTSDIAHELRTPLATLKSHVEAFQDGIWKPTPERLAGCGDEIIRLEKMVKDLAELSGIEAKEIILNNECIDLSELLNSVVENFVPLFNDKNIQVERDISKDILFFGDKDRLKQIFINVLSNAYKYNLENGKVRINFSRMLEKQESSRYLLVIIIEDSGIGINKNDLPLIFERFYRGEKSRSRETGGSGIGLTITKAFVEAHNGTINITSKKDAGTKVEIKFWEEVDTK